MRLSAGILLLTLLVVSGSYGQRNAGTSQSFESNIANARQAQSQSKFALAAQYYRKAAELRPDISEVWANLGIMCYESGQQVNAISAFQKSARLNSSLFVPQLFLGIEYVHQHQPTKAIPYLRHAVQLRPRDPQAALYLARALARGGELSQSIEAYEHAVQVSPKSDTVWFELGTTLLQRAERDAQLMTSRYSTSPYEQLRAAEVLTQEGKLVPAERFYRSALSKPHPILCAHAEFGINLLEQGDKLKADQEFHRDLQGERACGLARLGLAVLDTLNGKLDRAKAGFESVTVADPEFVRQFLPLFAGIIPDSRVDVLVKLTSGVRIDEEPKNDLGSVLKAGLSSHPESNPSAPPEISTGTSSAGKLKASPEALYRQGYYFACDSALRRVRSSAAGNAALLLARCSFFAGDFRTTGSVARQLWRQPANRIEGLYWESKTDEALARDALNRAGRLGGNAPGIHLMLGDVFRLNGKWTPAAEQYRKVLALDPHSRVARRDLAITLFSEYKLDQALQIDKSLLAEDPNDPQSNLLAAEIYVENHEYAAAVPYLNQCRNVGGSLAPRVHVLLGKVLAAAGHLKAAAQEMALGAASDQSGGVYYELARIYQKLGEKNAATAAFRKSEALRNRWDNRSR
jgi:tetratricopeptide (TPR) repeat protein